MGAARFRKQAHLRSPAEFELVYAVRATAKDRRALLFAAVSDGIYAYIQNDGTWWINNTGLVQIGNIFNSVTGKNVDFPSFNFLIFGTLLVLMMLFRREGFLPEARVRLIMHEEEFADAAEVHDNTKVAHHG